MLYSLFNFDSLKCPVLSYRCKSNCGDEATSENYLYVFIIYILVDVWFSFLSSTTEYNCALLANGHVWGSEVVILPFSSSHVLLSFPSASLSFLPSSPSFFISTSSLPSPCLFWCNFLEQRIREWECRNKQSSHD